MILLGAAADDLQRRAPAAAAAARGGAELRGAAGMNAPIIRLYGAHAAAVRGPGRLHVLLGRVRLEQRSRTRRPEPPPADRGADGQARHHQDRRRGDGRREPPGGRRQEPGLRARATRRARCSATRSATASSRSARRGSSGPRTRVLAGERNEFTSILDQLRDVPQEGDNVTLTIDSHAQRVATQALQSAIASTTGGVAGAGGAVVALDPSTGAVEGDGLGARLRPEHRSRTRRSSSS